MKIAFCLFKYFPYGGMQRDFLRIASECARRGHTVHVYTTRWEGEKDPALHIHKLKVKGRTNHARAKAFSRLVGQLTVGPGWSAVVGFNKMAHLDIYYAADVCYQTRAKANRSFLYRLMPRYRTYLALEKAVFVDYPTEILLLSAAQQAEYTSCYHTDPKRFHLLPPGITRDRLAPPDAVWQRNAMRDKLGLVSDQLMLLMIGSGYRTKGLDRAVKSLAALPAPLRQRCHLYVVGKGDVAPYEKLAKELGVDRQLHIMGPRPDVLPFLLAADLLLHPSYHENTGTVILEAMAAGLPVLTTAVCGYAHYVTEAGAGDVLAAPFKQRAWNAMLEKMLESTELPRLGANGAHFATNADIFSLPERAADFIEQWAKKRAVS